MLTARVIPTLLLRNNGLVKGAKFKKHKYVGDPINAVKIFNDKEVDELVFLDIEATNQGREPNFELIENIASQAFMPFGYGGGINSLFHIEKLFNIGVEKVILNTSAIEQPELISQASKKVGSQSIVVSIDAEKSITGRYRVVSRSGLKKHRIAPWDLAKKAEALGAGELIINSVDREGMLNGYDLELIKRVAAAVNIPVVASGGAANLQDFKQAVDAGASAAAAGDMFTFHGKHKAVLITYPKYEDLKKLFKG